MPAAPPPAQEVDLSEIWAEAEFYYQQGLFDEAKKHYAKIIQHDPSDTRAIDRLSEISREAVVTQEFSKLAEAVDELEGHVGGGAAGEELAASASDEEAVRSLMQEVAQQQQAAASIRKDAAAPAPPKAPAADRETHVTAVPGRTAVRQQDQRAEEDFFYLGEELRESRIPASPSERKNRQRSSQMISSTSLRARDELNSVAIPPPSSASAQAEPGRYLRGIQKSVESRRSRKTSIPTITSV
jgi:tetratricopeptide (TPR) repeat protein